MKPIVQISLFILLSVFFGCKSKPDVQPSPHVVVFPNPAVDLISLSLRYEKPTDVSVLFVDHTGKTRVDQQLYDVIDKFVTIPIQDLPKGKYYVEVKSNTRVDRIPFIKS